MIPTVGLPVDCCEAGPWLPGLGLMLAATVFAVELAFLARTSPWVAHRLRAVDDQLINAWRRLATLLAGRR